jgi:DNA-binding response OmpR family regulator
MRPKKVILLVEDDKAPRSVLSYVLRTNSYRVLEPANARSIPQAVALAMGADVALISNRPPKLDAGLFARRLTNARRGLSVLVLSDKAEPAFPYAHQTVARSLSIAELLERLKTLATRKGRPRKGFSRKTSVPNQPKATTDGH